MKIAIIGSGISGLSAAYTLYKNNHDVVLFEKDIRAGGHARTITVDVGSHTENIDTGFIVFNDRNYPLLQRFFEHLSIACEKSDMSFGISIGNGKIEYSSNNPLAQKSNIFKLPFWAMAFDILRFNQKAKKWINRKDITLGQMLEEFRGSEWFNEYYIKPMGAAIWSCSTKTIEDFPASAFINFFYNHGLLTVFKQPQWYTVKGGSKVYVDKITSILGDRVRTNCGVSKVLMGDKPALIDKSGIYHEFDKIILACHPDQSLELLHNPSIRHKDILSSFQYQKNKIIVHGDIDFMPRIKKAWASWIYLSDNEGSLSLSYWMNNLQNKNKIFPIIETLNPTRRPKESLIYDEYEFSHPVFTHAAIQAQQELDQIQGLENIYYCGAWCKNGFHEDGIASTVHVLSLLQEPVTWL